MIDMTIRISISVKPELLRPELKMRLEPLSGVRDVIIVFFVFSLIAQDRSIFSIRSQ